MSKDEQAATGSLKGYMQTRAEARDRATSERFVLPGFPAVEVELRLIGHKREHAIGDRIRRKVKDEADQILYTMADLLEKATVGFFVNDKAVQGVDNSWTGLCVSAYPEAVELSPRQAIIRLLTADGVPALCQDYGEWRGHRGEDDSDEVAEDLGDTP